MRDIADDTPRGHVPEGEWRPRHRVQSGPRAETDAPAGFGAMPVNERSYRRLSEPMTELRRRLPWPDERRRDDDEQGYVIHLPIRVQDLATATGLARTVAVSLAFLPELDGGETTVSSVDDQNNRHRVFCDLLLPDRSRCPQRHDHQGPCGEPPSPPGQRPDSAPLDGP